MHGTDIIYFVDASVINPLINSKVNPLNKNFPKLPLRHANPIVISKA